MIRPKRHTKSQQRRQTRRLLLDTALGLFASKGYDETSVEDICEKASLSKGAFYFHFAGKESLLAGALEEWAYPCSSEAEGWRVIEEDHGAERGPDGHASAALQLELWAQALRQERVRHHLRRSRSQFAASVRRRLQARPTSARTAQTEALIRKIVALRDGLIVQSLLLNDKDVEMRAKALVASVARRALNGELWEAADGGPQKRTA